MTTANALPADALLAVALPTASEPAAPASTETTTDTFAEIMDDSMEQGTTPAKSVPDEDNDDVVVDDVVSRPTTDLDKGEEKKALANAAMQMVMPVVVPPTPLPEVATTLTVAVTAIVADESSDAESAQEVETAKTCGLILPSLVADSPAPQLLTVSEVTTEKEPAITTEKSLPVQLKTVPTEMTEAKPDAADVPVVAALENQAAETTETTPEAPDGTGSAKQDSRMKKPVKMEVAAERTEKNLPPRQVLPQTIARAVNEMQKHSERTPEPAAYGLIKDDEVRIPQASRVAEIKSDAIQMLTNRPTETVEQPAASAEVRPVTVNRAINQITEQVVAFKRIGTQSLDVSMRPDRATEISLHLSMRDGQVEVIARLERGNFENLQVHWGELQQTLSQQGIRVGQLTQSQFNSQTPGHEFAAGYNQQSQQQAGRSPETLDELPLVGSPTEPLKGGRAFKPTPATRRGWEMWA